MSELIHDASEANVKPDVWNAARWSGRINATGVSDSGVVVWHAHEVGCCGQIWWGETDRPEVHDLSGMGDWQVFVDHQCGNCGARVGPNAWLAENLDEARRELEDG